MYTNIRAAYSKCGWGGKLRLSKMSRRQRCKHILQAQNKLGGREGILPEQDD